MRPAPRALALPGPRAVTSRGCVPRARPTPHQQRAFSRSAPCHASPDRPSPAGLAELSSRRLISVSGPDAAKYLQGVITANLFPGPASPTPQLRSDVGFYAAFLTAQGRLLHDVFIYRDLRSDIAGATSWLLEVDAAEADRLRAHIRRYKLRARFDVRLLDPAEARVYHAWDDAWAASSSVSPTTPPQSKDLITLADPRAPNLGIRILDLHPPTTNALPDLPLFTTPPPPVPEEAYRLRRYLHGVPEGQHELLRDAALPHESNLDVTGAIDFRKGCYVGQELTIRTEHRGMVRKRVLPCLLYPHEDVGNVREEVKGGLEEAYRPTVGEDGVTADMVPAEVSIGRVGRKGRSAGKWLRGVGNVGLALCRLENMTDLALPGESGGVGFVEGDEFVVGLGDGEGGAEGRKVGIKAFVPDWLRSALEGKNGGH